MSFQPEERYWTDYLRIALPVMGLLLLIGLLWFWATALIGSPGDQPPPTQTTLAAVTEINATPPPAAPTATSLPVAPTPGLPAPTATVAAVTAVDPTPLPQPTVPPTVPPAAADAAATNPCANLPPSYPVDTIVETTEVVNLREGPSTDSNIITELPAGTTVTVTGEFAEAGQCDWWPVSVPSTEQSGFVREDFLRESGTQ